MSDRFVTPIMTVQDSNGNALSGALAYFYETGTSTLKDTFTDNTYTTPQSNPVVADSQGSFDSIFLQGEYRVDLQDSVGVSQPGYPADNVFVAKFDRQSKSVLALTMTDTDITLTDEQFDNAAFDISGVLTDNLNLIIPDTENVFIVDNETSGAFSITVKHALSSGIEAPQGSVTQFYTTGSKVEGVFSSAGGTFTTLVTFALGADIASAATVDLTAATGNTVHITGTTTTTAFTMNSGQWMELIADAAWPLTFNAVTMNITGGLDYTCSANDRLFVAYDGTTTYVNVTPQDGFSPASQSEVRLHTSNGYGSTNTKIRRFLTPTVNVGSSITYTDSATLGGLFAINKPGFYVISYTDNFSASSNLGITLNSSEPTTNIGAVTSADVLAMSSTQAANDSNSIGAPVYLVAGDFIWAHAQATSDGTPSRVHFSIVRVG